MFISWVTCDSHAQACLKSQCEACKDRIDNFTPSNASNALCYLQWQNTNSRVGKVEIIGAQLKMLYICQMQAGSSCRQGSVQL